MKLTFENIHNYIGRKVRIVKICAPFFKRVMLGKVDDIDSVGDTIFLRDLKMNVNPDWIELVDEQAVDIEMELNEQTIYNPFKK